MASSICSGVHRCFRAYVVQYGIVEETVSCGTTAIRSWRTTATRRGHRYCLFSLIHRSGRSYVSSVLEWCLPLPDGFTIATFCPGSILKLTPLEVGVEAARTVFVSLSPCRCTGVVVAPPPSPLAILYHVPIHILWRDCPSI